MFSCVPDPNPIFYMKPWDRTDLSGVNPAVSNGLNFQRRKLGLSASPRQLIDYSGKIIREGTFGSDAAALIEQSFWSTAFWTTAPRPAGRACGR
jgi:hypothetical protein